MDAKAVYNLEGHDYLVAITYKRIRNIHFRFDGEMFLISCPKRTSWSLIKSGLDKYAKRLVKRCPKASAIGDDFIYLFGQRMELSYPGLITLSDETKIEYNDTNQLMKKLRKYFLNYITSRVFLFEQEMHAPHYLVKVRQMKSRYGSNNRSSKTLTFSMTLIHYSPEIIDSVVIHELTHCFVYDHSDNFYRLLYKYCPNYDMLRKKLIKAEYQ